MSLADPSIRSLADQLPEELWKLVLQHVPLQQRLVSCALVCHKLHSAAVAATECIEATLSTQRRLDSFTTYLQQHGRHITGIMVAGRSDAPVFEAYTGASALPQPAISGSHQLGPEVGPRSGPSRRV